MLDVETVPFVARLEQRHAPRTYTIMPPDDMQRGNGDECRVVTVCPSEMVLGISAEHFLSLILSQQ